MRERYGESPANRIVELEKTCLQLNQSKGIHTNIIPLSLSSHLGINHVEPPTTKTKQMRQYKSSCSIKSNKDNKKQPAIPDISSIPSVFPNTLPDSEIKRRTGFSGEISMLSYIMIVCNGEIDEMTKTTSQMLTWFEEWLYYFEALWGRTHTRWEDLSAMYRISDRKIARNVFDSKAYLVLCCRSSWPVYVSYEEDKTLRKEKWNEKYDKKRIIMWDDTNIPFCFKPGTAKKQRLTYSSYYSMNCAKGGVFLQLCGWMGVGELWCGAISDSTYIEKEKILEKQRDFAMNDLVEDQHIPGSNMLDKGYRIVRLAWSIGKQLCIQPPFASSDRKFTSDEMLVAASVAADRSGNERAVKLAKKSGLLKRGLKPRASPIRLNNAWMSWSFQVNFMYAPVL